MRDSIRIELSSKELTNRLQILLNRGENMGPIMSAISARMLTAVQDNFQQEGRPDSWPDLAEVTKEMRRKKGHWPGKMLNISQGGLYPSIQADSDDNVAMVSTDKVYGPIQNFGGKAGRNLSVTLPAREYMNIPDDDAEEIIDILENFIHK
jgi:phage virion morphogenesis protein